jgi:hypothetical protein
MCAIVDQVTFLACAHTTLFCCTSVGCGGGQLDLQDFLPGTFPYMPPPPLLAQKEKQSQNIYCPVQERPFLEHCLIKWLELVHSEDPLCSVRPPHLILSDIQHATLVRAHPSKLSKAEDITSLLNQTSEWASEWSHGLFEVITQFTVDYACISEKNGVQRKRKQQDN